MQPEQVFNFHWLGLWSADLSPSLTTSTFRSAVILILNIDEKDNSRAIKYSSDFIHQQYSSHYPEAFDERMR